MAEPRGPPGRSPHSGREAGVCREQDNVLSGGSQEWEKGPTRALKRGRWGRLWMSARQASVTLCCRWRQRWGSEAPSGRGLSRCRNPAPGFLTPTVSLQQRPPPHLLQKKAAEITGVMKDCPGPSPAPLSQPDSALPDSRQLRLGTLARAPHAGAEWTSSRPPGPQQASAPSTPPPTPAPQKLTGRQQTVKGGLPWWFSG